MKKLAHTVRMYTCMYNYMPVVCVCVCVCVCVYSGVCELTTSSQV